MNLQEMEAEYARVVKENADRLGEPEVWNRLRELMQQMRELVAEEEEDKRYEE